MYNSSMQIKMYWELLAEYLLLIYLFCKFYPSEEHKFLVTHLDIYSYTFSLVFWIFHVQTVGLYNFY